MVVRPAGRAGTRTKKSKIDVSTLRYGWRAQVSLRFRPVLRPPHVCPPPRFSLGAACREEEGACHSCDGTPSARENRVQQEIRGRRRGDRRRGRAGLAESERERAREERARERRVRDRAETAVVLRTPGQARPGQLRTSSGCSARPCAPSGRQYAVMYSVQAGARAGMACLLTYAVRRAHSTCKSTRRPRTYIQTVSRIACRPAPFQLSGPASSGRGCAARRDLISAAGLGRLTRRPECVPAEQWPEQPAPVCTPHSVHIPVLYGVRSTHNSSCERPCRLPRSERDLTNAVLSAFRSVGVPSFHRPAAEYCSRPAAHDKYTHAIFPSRCRCQSPLFMQPDFRCMSPARNRKRP